MPYGPPAIPPSKIFSPGGFFGGGGGGNRWTILTHNTKNDQLPSQKGPPIPNYHTYWNLQDYLWNTTLTICLEVPYTNSNSEALGEITKGVFFPLNAQIR